MRSLLLIRHAKSSWDDPECDDFDRPLNNRGRSAAPIMGQRLHQELHRCDQIFVSTACRAQQTLGGLLQGARLSNQALVSFHDSLYHASAEALRGFIQQLSDAHRHVAIIAHNPGLTAFAAHLAPACAPDNIVTCGAVYFKQTQKWQVLNDETAHFQWYRYPKQMASSMSHGNLL